MRYFFKGDKYRPFEVIVDEASQVPSYLTWSLIHAYPTIRKLVLVGDPEQLSPFGTIADTKIKSSFEVLRQKQEPIFLDLQFRLPLPLAELVSKNAYESRLCTVPEKAAPPTCIQWVNIAGKEERDGHS